MIHNLTIGHLDADALHEGKVVLLRPLDMTLVSQLLGEMGQKNAQGKPSLGGFPVDMRDGFVVCRWLVPGPNRCVEEFARKLQERTGCLLADVKRREIIAAERFTQHDDCATASTDAKFD